MTKKIAAVFLAMATALSSMQFVAFADSAEIIVEIDGTEQIYDKYEKSESDVMLPLRKLCEQLGAEVGWSEKSDFVTVMRNDTTLVVEDNSSSYTVNEKIRSGNTAVFRKDDVTYVPCEVVADAFGYSVTHGENKIVFTLKPVELPRLDGFGQGKDPYEWAKEMISTSGVRSDSDASSEYVQADGYEKTTDGSKYRIPACQTTYTRGGTYANSAFDTDTQIYVKSVNDQSVTRNGFIKFDLTNIKETSTGNAYVEIHVNRSERGATAIVEFYEMDASLWDASTLTWNNSPKLTKPICKVYTTATADWNKINVTDYVNEILAAGKKQISVAIKDTSGYATVFDSINNTKYAPRLILSHPGEPAGSTYENTNEEYVESPEYSVTVQAADSTSRSYWGQPTRTIDTLDGYNINDAVDNLDEYGGNMDVQMDATGWFYVTKTDNRWWLVDPLGHPFYSKGINTVSRGTTNRQRNSLFDSYGSYENWGNEISKFLKHDLKLNTVGAWSAYDYLNKADDENRLATMKIIYAITNYADYIGTKVDSFGHAVFASNNCLSVFDPDFITYADSIVKSETEGWRDDPHVIGYMSDNELPINQDMLKRYLTLDPSEPYNAYSYATAWTWFREKTGKNNPTLSDINDSLSASWIEFVYDRYFKVVSQALDKYAPNQLYLGCRFMSGGYDNESMMRAAGRYCDIITANYYFAWTPTDSFLSNCRQWADKPFIVTEAYAMAEDSKLENAAGGGFVVKTQMDRGMFYQNYSLKLLESDNCVGFHWFMFMDNDYSVMGDESTKYAGVNKGVFNSDYIEYTTLTTQMKRINANAYNLIDFFTKRRKEQGK